MPATESSATVEEEKNKKKKVEELAGNAVAPLTDGKTMREHAFDCVMTTADLKWNFPFQVILWCTWTTKFVGKVLVLVLHVGLGWLLQFPRVMSYCLLSVPEELPLGYTEWYRKLSYLLYIYRSLTFSIYSQCFRQTAVVSKTLLIFRIGYSIYRRCRFFLADWSFL